jgi:phage tail sheath protein FI
MNSSLLHNKTVDAYTLHYPTHMTANVNFAVGSETVGDLDTAANGIIDADRFCNNVFTLSNIKVVTGSNTLADPDMWASSTYVRNGVIPTNASAKTRALLPTDLTNANRRFIKFVTIMQGGFDGVNIFDKDEAQINDNAVAADVLSTRRGNINGPAAKAYTSAIKIMGDETETDIQLLTIPGIRQPIVTDTAINAVENRVDAMYLMDPILYDATDTIINSNNKSAASPTYTSQEFTNRGLDSSFAAAYFPDIIMLDPTTKTNVVAPGTVAALSAMSLNDAIGKPWLAPAGKTRGAIVDGVEPSVILSQEQIDLLYDSSLNPIISFPSPERGGIALRSGAVVWGQKTLLQRVNSAFDRVNVRRLLIAVRRIVRKAVMSILFEPNRESTLASFTSKVNPQLQRIQNERGLNGYRLIVDSSTTTQADIENNTVRGKLLLAPVNSIEFVSIDFTVTNGGLKG